MLGDLDGDGDLDLVYGNNNKQTSVWFNDGTGTFTENQKVGQATATDLAIGDIDGDGDLDLVLAYDADPNEVWLNDGTGTFAGSGQTLDAATTEGVALGDVDGDGDLDLTYANNGSANTIWLNEPSSNWTAPQAVWRQNGKNTRFFNRWNGAGFDGTQSSAVTGDFRIMQGERAPTRDEALLMGVDVGGKIAAERWDGSTWAPLGSSLGGTDQTFWWGFDVAYESLSGDAVLVYAETSNLRYAVWDGTTLTEAATPIPQPYAGTPRQMHLAADPTSDEMVLVVSNSASQDFAYVWNGSSWSSAEPLDPSGAGNDRTDINVAYEQQSGRAVVTYGKGTGTVYSKLWDGSWSSEIALTGLGTGYARWTVLAADPNSNNLALGVLTSGNQVWVASWTNVGWIDQTLATGTSTGTTELAVAVAFEGSSGQALATFGDGTTTPGTRVWTAGSGWAADPDVPVLGAVSNSMVLYGDRGSDGIMLVVQDDSSDLHWIHWSGFGWSIDHELETDSGETKNQPFLFIP